MHPDYSFPSTSMLPRQPPDLVRKSWSEQAKYCSRLSEMGTRDVANYLQVTRQSRKWTCIWRVSRLFANELNV
uniref:Uncharacterized protein n=1 Tax=Caenorhabditis tropicalis TaxID=1561998 RepID=A0A1I7TF42_9PELO